MGLYIIKYYPKEDQLTGIATKTQGISKELPQCKWIMSQLPEFTKEQHHISNTWKFGIVSKFGK
eukprot:5876185-Ditylum_brightwellii.AAC.1